VSGTRFAVSPQHQVAKSIQAIVIATGLVAAVAGLSSQAMVFFPTRWGDMNWEVSVFGQLSATSALPMLGLGVLGVEALVAGRRWQVFGISGLLVLFGAIGLLGALTVSTALPMVWNAAATVGGTQGTGFKIVTVKALALCGLYAVFSIGIAGQLVRTIIRRRV